MRKHRDLPAPRWTRISFLLSFAQSRSNPNGVDKERPIIYLALEQLVAARCDGEYSE